MRFVLLPILLLSLVCNFCFAQNPFADSLKTVLAKSKEDTVKVNTLTTLATELRKSNLDSAVIVGKQALELSKKLKWKKGIGFSNHILGVFFYMEGDHKQSLTHDNAALSIWKELINSGNKSEAAYAKLHTAKTSGNVANIYIDQANYTKALEFCFKALGMAEELGDKKVQAINLGNIGNIYRSQKDIPKALEYYNKALTVGSELKDPVFTLNQLNNIASAYKEQKNYVKALDCYNKNLKMAEEFGIKQTQAGSLGSIGLIYAEQLKYDEAINYFLKALVISNEVGDKRLIIFNLTNLGGTYRKMGKFKESEKYLLEGLAIAEETGAPSYLMSIEDNLGNLYDTTGRSALALEHYKNFITYRDSITNQENRKELFRSELNYEFEKKELAAIAEQEKKDALAAEEKQQQRMILYFVAIAALVITGFSISLYKRYKVTQRQKGTIEIQKQQIEEHQKEMVDSITYAKRIQDAILPPIELIKEKLPNTFVLYKPKDIVAGDFYWMESIISKDASGKESECVLIAAADCTGHGVPGAMVSVVCSNALNRAVKEFHLSDTGLILDKVTDLVLETFEKSATEVKDGMDISLLSINKHTGQIKWSGANNPLWYFETSVSSSGVENKELKEITADKQPIGKSDHRKPFTTHTIEYKAGNTFYLFTDGYADQFGGPKGKKFKYKQFQEALSTLLNKSPLEQQEALNNGFESWKGNLEQVDDVSVIGIRL